MTQQSFKHCDHGHSDYQLEEYGGTGCWNVSVHFQGLHTFYLVV